MVDFSTLPANEQIAFQLGMKDLRIAELSEALAGLSEAYRKAQLELAQVTADRDNARNEPSQSG